MKFEDKDDFFDGPDIPEEPKEEKKPAPKPEEPDYWEGPESEWEHLKPNRDYKTWLIVALAGLAIGVVVALAIRYFSPYETDASQYGYVETISYRGDIFKSFEGVLLPYKEIHDTTRVYREDFRFSVRTDSVAAKLKRFQLQGRPVRVEYKRYHTSMPWRGETPVIITAVDSVDPLTILPPEFRNP